LSNDDNQKSITVFELEELQIEEIGPEGRPMHPRGGPLDRIKRVIAKQVPKDQFQKNISDFISQTQDILSKSMLVSTGEFNLDTVEVNAEISAGGQIGFMGTGLSMEGKGGIKFVFKHINRIGAQKL
jgi:hypothetical protein